MISLAGQDYELSADYDALRKIEEEAQMGFLMLAQKLLDKTITLNEIALILQYLTEKGKLPPPPEHIKALLVQGNVANATQAIAEVFANVIGRDQCEP